MSFFNEISRSESERSLLASGATVRAAGEAAAGFESRGEVTLRGRAEPLEVFGFGQTTPA